MLTPRTPRHDLVARPWCAARRTLVALVAVAPLGACWGRVADEGSEPSGTSTPADPIAVHCPAVPFADASASCGDESPGGPDGDAAAGVSAGSPGRVGVASEGGAPGEGPGVCPTPPREPAATCSKALVFETVTPPDPSCHVHQLLREGQLGTLAYDCNGGVFVAAHLDGDAPLAGTLAPGGGFSLCGSMNYAFDDGCRWSTTQTLEGALGGGPLRYRYTESPLAGESGCDEPCVAVGLLHFEESSAP